MKITVSFEYKKIPCPPGKQSAGFTAMVGESEVFGFDKADLAEKIRQRIADTSRTPRIAIVKMYDQLRVLVEHAGSVETRQPVDATAAGILPLSWTCSMGNWSLHAASKYELDHLRSAYATAFA